MGLTSGLTRPLVNSRLIIQCVLGQAISIFEKALPESEVAMLCNRMFQLMLGFK